MPFFKKKDKTASATPQPQGLAPPAESRPDLREETSNSTFGTAPSNNNDGDSNLSSADTRVNHQNDSNGNKQTVVTTTTTTTTTTVTSDGRVITEQHERPASEQGSLPPRGRSPEQPTQSLPVQSSATPVPNIPNRDARRSMEAPIAPSSNMAQHREPPPPVPYQHQQQQSAPQSAPSPTSTNFSRPGGRRENVKQAALGVHGIGESLRGAFNAKAGELLGDDPETLAKNKEVRDSGMRDMKGLRDVRGSTMMQRKPIGEAPVDDRTRLRRKSGGLRAEDGVSRNF